MLGVMTGGTDPSSHQARLARVHGRVQGVGYRDACVREARRLGLTGWVRNRLDGSVETLLQGTPRQLDEMQAWLRRGPPPARVERVDVLPVAAEDWPLFERRSTA